MSHGRRGFRFDGRSFLGVVSAAAVAQMHESWAPEIDGEWAKTITQNVPDVFLNFWKEGKDMKYKWYLCIKK